MSKEVVETQTTVEEECVTQETYVPVVNQIGVTFSGLFPDTPEDILEDFGEMSKGEVLFMLMQDVCYTLGEASNLTEGKVDLEFVLSVVASYLISKEKGDLPDDVVTPSELFEEKIFKILDTVEVSKDEVPDDAA